MVPPTLTDAPPGVMSEFNRLDHEVRAAIFWLSTTDGFKMMKCVSPETLKLVYADLVRAGQYKPEVPDVRKEEGPGAAGVPERGEGG